MTTMLLLLLASVAALTQAAPVANQTTSPPAPPCTNNWPQGLHEIEYRGRKFLLAVPDGLPNGGGRRVPVVFDWHGYSESPWYQNLLVGLTDTLEEYTWIGVLPFGTAPLPTGTCCPLVGCDEECCHNGEMLDPLNACSVNAGSCCGAASNRDEDDITFARIILEWLQLEMCPDEDNLFATGFSNGGMITNRLGCQAADMFKAIAPVAGNMRFGNGFTECAPTSPVSWLSVCGSADGVCNSDFEETAVRWSRLNGCEGEPQTTFVSATTRCEAWLPRSESGGPGCTGNVFVEYCLVDDLGHEWSGRDRPDGNSPQQPPTNIDATMYMFNRWSTLL